MEIRLLLHFLRQNKVHLLISCLAQCCPLEVMSRPGDNVMGCTGVQMPKGVSRLCTLGRCGLQTEGLSAGVQVTVGPQAS